MKVVLFNGSPKKKGSTARALTEVAEQLEAAGIQTETLHLGKDPVHGCVACGWCNKNEGCQFNDDITNTLIEAARGADGFIFGSPVYFAAPNGAMCAVLDRAFYAKASIFAGKPGAAVAVARRGGTTATIDRLNKYFSFAHMPIVGSQYWNILHGNNAAEVEQDLEGMQTMRALGRNMASLLKSLEAGKAGGEVLPAPSDEDRVWTNFIR